jgi:hypothetical protein
MSSFPDAARRRFVSGLWGSLIFIATGIVLYFLEAPHYELFLYLFFAYVAWVYLRFRKEQKQSAAYAPWYTSRPKAALSASVIFSFIGIFAFIKHSADYQSDFLLAGMFLVIAGITQYREAAAKDSSRDQDHE